MLYLVKVEYIVGCSNVLLKLKFYLDVEVVVIEYIVGKGKYKNMFGVLKVCNNEGIEFKIGFGFFDL